MPIKAPVPGEMIFDALLIQIHIPSETSFGVKKSGISSVDRSAHENEEAKTKHALTKLRFELGAPAAIPLDGPPEARPQAWVPVGKYSRRARVLLGDCSGWVRVLEEKCEGGRVSPKSVWDHPKINQIWRAGRTLHPTPR